MKKTAALVTLGCEDPGGNLVATEGAKGKPEVHMANLTLGSGGNPGWEEKRYIGQTYQN